MTLLDDVQSLLHDALVVSSHARPVDGKGAIEPGDTFLAAFTVENVGFSSRSTTQARAAFIDVSLRIEATPFAAPIVDGEPVNDVDVAIGELIHGEARTVERQFRALAALDGPEPYARAIVVGRLDLERFFTVQAVHRFTTEIHRAPASDPAVEAFAAALRADALPEGFALCPHTFDFDDASAFALIVDDLDRFRGFVRERVAEIAESRGLADEAIAVAAVPLAVAYVDVFETGFQAALAFALWFTGFDQGESIAFDAVRACGQRYFEGYELWEQRRELRLIKGFDNDLVLADPITVVDLPVTVDHGARTVTLWAGSLRS